VDFLSPCRTRKRTNLIREPQVGKIESKERFKDNKEEFDANPRISGKEKEKRETVWPRPIGSPERSEWNITQPLSG